MRAVGHLATRYGTAVALLLGVLAVVLATVLGGATDLLGRLVTAPPPARLLLGVAACLVGVVLVLRAADRLATSRDARELIRAVRLIFLAVAAFAAAAGWFAGSALPIVVALVIAGIDVIETSLLLLVTATRAPGR